MVHPKLAAETALLSGSNSTPLSRRLADSKVILLLCAKR